MSQLAQDDILKASDSSVSFLAVTNQFFTLYPHIHTIVDNFVTKLNLEIPPQKQQHIQHYGSVLSIARWDWDTSSCFFFYSIPYHNFKCLCPSHHCHLWFHLELFIPKPNGSNRINGSLLFQADNFVWCIHSA